MTSTDTRETVQLQSFITDDGNLKLSLVTVPIPPLGDTEVLIEVRAAAVNPSDLGLIFGAADIKTLKFRGEERSAEVNARVPEAALPAMKGRIGVPLVPGNEGAGIVVAAGSSDTAQALLGKTVAVLVGGMYSQYRVASAEQCMVLPEGVEPIAAASALVNPLTALGMIETMRSEGHKALVHTAAASSLGQILNRLCLKDGVGLVNIVRSKEQVDLLHSQGASHVVNSDSENFLYELISALDETGATVAFDATGGGLLAGQILNSMEAVLVKKNQQYSRYGSTTHKQVYLYGGLDVSPTVVSRDAGMAWGIGGWILFGFLKRIGSQAEQKLKERIADELTSTFSSTYAGEISLAEALNPAMIKLYSMRKTGGKYVINPSKN